MDNAKFLLNFDRDFEFGKDYSYEGFMHGSEEHFNNELKNLVKSDMLHVLDPLFKINKNANSFSIEINNANSLPSTALKSNLASAQSIQNIAFNNLFNSNSKRVNLAFNDFLNAREFANNDVFYRTTQRRIQRRGNLNASSNEINRTENRTRQDSNVRLNSNARDSNARLNSSAQDKNHFFFAPFVGYKILGDFSGLNYGFAGGYSARLNQNNELGIYVGFDYGKLENTISLNIGNLNVSSLNAGGGLGYKLHFGKLSQNINHALKIFADVFYSNNNFNLYGDLGGKKALNNLIFSGNIYYGIDFDFARAGNLGLNLGLNYNGINKMSDFSYDLSSPINYKKGLNHALFADINLGYDIDFNFGMYLNALLGAKINAFALKEEFLVNNIAFKQNLGIDRFGGYASLGLGYEWSKISLGLHYLGSFSQNLQSHNGFLNLKVWW